MDSVRVNVKAILEGILLINAESIGDLEPLKDLGFSSIDSLDLATKLEQWFKIKVENDDIAKLKTVDDIVSFVEAKSNG